MLLQKVNKKVRLCQWSSLINYILQITLLFKSVEMFQCLEIIYDIYSLEILLLIFIKLLFLDELKVFFNFIKRIVNVIVYFREEFFR